MRYKNAKYIGPVLVILIFLPAFIEGNTGAADEPSLDVKLFRFFNTSLVNPFFDWLMPIITDLNRWRIIILLVWSVLVIFGGSKGRWAALMLIPLIAASDQLASQAIKPLAERIRPCEVLGSVHLWYGKDGWIITPAGAVGGFKISYSFPSSHATNITASMLFLTLVYRRWTYFVCLPIAVLVSFSRIYIGVHWPSDVAAGMLIGAGLAWLAYFIFKRIKIGKKEKEPSDNGKGIEGPEVRPVE